ncbi:MAG: anti-sigma factor [Bosea sp. (in: a-proteobacteria)]
MSATTLKPDPERDAASGEYAFGLMDAAEMAAFEARMAREPDLATRVSSWRRHLTEVDLTATLLPVPDDLWPGIEAALEREPAQPALPASPTNSLLDRLWGSIGLWRWGALASAAAALTLAVGLASSVQRAALQPVLVAVLMTADREAAAIVNVAADGRAELKPLKAFEVPAGKAIEIWTLWDRSVGPKSIGLIGQTRGTRLDLRNLPRQPGQLFEMTLEPATGSPTGRPTGPVLTIGNATTPL